MVSSNLPKSEPFFDGFLPWLASKMGQIIKNKAHFLGDLKTPKFHSEINWPLVCIFAVFVINIVQKLKCRNRNRNLKSNVKLFKWRYWLGFLPRFSNVIWQTIFLHSLGRDQKLQEKKSNQKVSVHRWYFQLCIKAQWKKYLNTIW